ncbi:hypothetical protein [Legionella cardiaca]|uniref:Uncharacterized protein n=1 Tax=Legionella cardiaca TaxID=1071983 RepID=A0ABY8AS95_9GAMM|nr:hypothetical protein [Legionella cardiaca]WED42037.1 hypothetical protein PXX05_08835 [Legionella cardiaca]
MSKERYEDNEYEQLSIANPLEVFEILGEIAGSLSNREITNKDKESNEQELLNIINAREAYTASSRLFYHVSAKVPRSHIVTQLLLRTAQGKEDSVKQLFELAPACIRYLIAKSDVEDYSGRRFKNISAFQYALWSWDWHMWEMMLAALEKAEIYALDNNPDKRIDILTKQEIIEIRTTLLDQYHEVVDKGLDYTVSRVRGEGDNDTSYTVEVKGENHFDLTGPEFCFIPEDDNFIPEKGKIYVKIVDNLLHYTVISLSGERVNANIPLANLNLPQLDTLADLKPFVISILNVMAESGHTHPQSLISSLTTYCEQYGGWHMSEWTKHWCQVVGAAQRELPANIAQEYCRTDVLLNNTRSFKESNFPRTLEYSCSLIYKNNGWFPLNKFWFPLTADNKLGTDYGIFGCTRDWPGGAASGGTERRARDNLEGLLTLCQVRAEQVSELGNRLSKQVQEALNAREQSSELSNFSVQ